MALTKLATVLKDKGIVANCTFCEQGGYNPVKQAKWDLPTIYGSWAYACHTHGHQFGKKEGKAANFNNNW